MTRYLFLDIETYSPAEGFNFGGMKIITIQYKWCDNPAVTVQSDWEAEFNEKTLLQNFAAFLKTVPKDTCIIGHNILRFDIPFLIYRMQVHGIDTPENLLGLFHNTIVIDTIQALLPYNNFFYKGTGASLLDESLNLNKMKHSNKEIKSFYENENERYKIKEHAEGDVLFTEALWKLLASGAIESKNGRITLKESA